MLRDASLIIFTLGLGVIFTSLQFLFNLASWEYISKLSTPTLIGIIVGYAVIITGLVYLIKIIRNIDKEKKQEEDKKFQALIDKMVEAIGNSKTPGIP